MLGFFDAYIYQSPTNFLIKGGAFGICMRRMCQAQKLSYGRPPILGVLCRKSAGCFNWGPNPKPRNPKLTPHTQTSVSL